MLDSKIKEKLIISSDDFGISQLANQKILALVRLGKMDRVEVMMNGFVSQEEADELGRSGVKIDIHFDLEDGIKKDRKLKEGVVKRAVIFLWNYISGKTRGRGIEKKWSEQVDKFMKLFGKKPDGASSHQYIHYFPPYFRMILKLAKKYEIPFVRFGAKGIIQEKSNVCRILSILQKMDRKYFDASFSYPDYMVSLDWIGNLDSFLKNLPEGKTEIICHPERVEEYDIILKYF
jgi:predicted glycoside hydrolase/deacetylase ChbG (UPF0249 family)